MNVYYVDALPSGYAKLLEELVQNGDVVSPRGQKTYEQRDVTIQLANPHDVVLSNVGRKLSLPLLCVEALQLVGGFSDPELLTAVAPRYRDFADIADDGSLSLHGAYGERIGSKVHRVIDRLRVDHDTRRACMTFWEDERDLFVEDSKDFPCTVYANFAIRDGELLMTTCMRSNDAWLGLVYDLPQFTALQRAIARFLRLKVGLYTHFVNSFHLYHRDVEKALDLVKTIRAIGDVPRPTLAGGIGTYGFDSWKSVQDHASMLCYSPCELLEAERDRVALTSEERWIATVMADWWESQ